MGNQTAAKRSHIKSSLRDAGRPSAGGGAVVDWGSLHPTAAGGMPYLPPPGILSCLIGSAKPVARRCMHGADKGRLARSVTRIDHEQGFRFISVSYAGGAMPMRKCT
jgi:hypothetical protein